MVEKIHHYQQIARDLIERDQDLRTLQYEFEAISQLESALPEPLDSLEHIIPFNSTVPYDALRGGQRALSALDERLNIHPITVQKMVEGYGGGLQAQQVANHWETALKWMLNGATRRVANFRPSVVWNALVYDELVGQVIHLPTQIKSLRAFGGGSSRQEAALRYGDFAIRLVDPKTVHTRHSEYMLEEVVSVNKMTAQQVVDFWGKKAAKNIWKQIRDDVGHASHPYIVADYSSLNDRAVWAVEGEDEDVIQAGEGNVLLEPTKNPYPFIPWVAKVGGTSTESDIKHRRKPLLYPVARAQQWYLTNILGTLGLSQGVSEANAPLHWLAGTGADDIVIDHREPGGVVYTMAHQKYQQLIRQNIDPGIRELQAKYEADMNRATLPSVLVTAEAMPGESFSGYNMRVQTAIGALMPFKILAERFYEDVFRTMLLYSHYSGMDLKGYDDKAGIYIIKSSDIDPDVLELKVELSPDVPVDRIQKINAAVQMAERLNYSPIKILEFLGETDPHGAFEEWISWKFIEAKVAGRIQRITLQESGELQQMAQQMAQGMIAQAQQQQQQQTPAGGDMSGMTSNNPAMGGQAPITGMGEGATFEGATGETRGMGGGV